MTIPPVRKLHLELSTGRIENLVDGVFAIAMTVLVLNLDIGSIAAIDRGAPLDEALWRMWPRLLHYFESFIILSAFWIKHHQQYHFIRRSDRGMLWINLLGLFFVSLIPFSTDLMGDYGHVRLAAFLFEGNMLIAGLIYCWHWDHATRGRRLVDRDLEEGVVRFYRQGNLIVPAVSVVALAASAFDPRLGTLAFVFIPGLFLLLRNF